MSIWTKAQEEALKSKGSILVSASAGTGKTSVLTEKVVKSIIDEGVSFENILVMTFSSAAAEEMKTRIINKFREACEDKSLSIGKRASIYKQLSKIHTANIQTIHSFCNDIVRQYHYKVGLNGSFSVCDNLESAIYKKQAAKKTLHKEFMKKDPVFIELAESFDDSESIEDIFIEAYSKIITNIDVEAWLRSAVEEYNADSDFPEIIKTKIMNDIGSAIFLLDDVMFAIDVSKDEKLKKISNVIESDLSFCEYLLSEIKKGNKNIFEEIDFSSFGKTVRFPNGNALIKTKRNKARDIIKSYFSPVFNVSEQTRRIKHMYPMVKKFAEILLAFSSEYSEIKKENNVIDFNDMERYANEILSDYYVSQSYKGLYKYVFVDEYQDTSPIQESIIQQVSNENNLFCVGDQKQSIYRFRASDPTLFTNRSKRYRGKTAKGKVVALNNNFRSSKNILACANDIFNKISACSQEMAYTEEDKLVHSRSDDENINTTEVVIVPETVKERLCLSPDEVEVYSIVDIINEQLKDKIYDDVSGGHRNVEYGDITIICRKLSTVADIFARVFTANNIPYNIEQSGGLLDTQEVKSMLSILELVVDAENDISVSAFIHEGFLEFTDDDLIKIRALDFTKTLFKNIKALSQKDNALGIKCSRFISFLDSIKNFEKSKPITEAVGFILSSLNFFDFYAVQKNGEQRVANIKLFQQYIYNFEQKNHGKIYAFLEYIKDIKNSNILIDQAKINLSKNSVRITTIHKSKGLEYPIVILPFMNKAFSTKDRRLNVSIEREIGLGFRYYNSEKKEKGKTVIRNIVDDAISLKSKEEEMRLLYVAMTRAKEKLIIQGTHSLAKIAFPEDANSMMDWILSSISDIGEENIEVNEALTGKWFVRILKDEDITPWFREHEEKVSSKDFLNRFSLPVIKKQTQEDTVSNIPLAITSSRIFIDTANPENLFNRPKFAHSTNFADVGIANHTFFKHIDFTGDLSVDGLMIQRENMVNDGIFDKNTAALINIFKIESFLSNDPVAKMIINSDKLKREVSLSFIESSKFLGFSVAPERNVLVRSIVDLIFCKDGQWYLVDYKTDKIKNENDNAEIQERIETHRPQMELYKKAIKENLSIEIADTFLVFIDISKAISINTQKL